MSFNRKTKLLAEDCAPEAGEDRSLPYTSYLVKYKLDGSVRYDLVIAKKKVDVFDDYWDLYRHDFISFDQTEGRVNPKLWNPPKKEK